MPKDFSLQFCSRSHTGKVKRNNEDYLRIHQNGFLAAIADGMGGTDFGEVASQIAVDASIEYLANTTSTKLLKKPAGELGNVKVNLKAVKQRDLPEIDDAFAKLSSEFETLAELKADLATRLTKLKQMQQGAQARDLLLEKLLSSVEIPLPDEIIKDEVDDHLEKEGKLDDDKHRAEVNEEVKKTITREFLLDSIVKAESVAVNEGELTEYLLRAAARYGMSPDQFIKEVSQAGQVSTMVAEVARAKALAQVLGRVDVVDKSGNKIDLEALRPQTSPASEPAQSLPEA